MGTLLYLAQGIPQGLLFYAIPAWLAVNGQSAASIGAVVAAAALPWSLKFIMGGIVDRYTFLPMGRRRAWLIGAQVVIVITATLFALRNPSPEDMPVIIGFIFLLSCFTALQDVALDAMVIDLTPEAEIGQINGFMFGGKLVGIAMGSALTAYFLEHFNLPVAIAVTMVLFSIPAVSAILIRERPGERYLPWSKGTASKESIAVKPHSWWPLLRDSLRSILRRDPLFVIALSIIYGIHQGIFDASMPLFTANELGWGETRFSAMSGSVNIVLAILSLTVGGWATDRYGPGRLALISGICSALIMALLLFLDQFWQNDTLFTIWYVANRIVTILFYLCMLTLGMRVCEAHVAATTFTLIMASMAVGMAIGSGSLGWLEQIGGFYAMFFAASIIVLFSASMAIGLSHKASGPIQPKSQRKLKTATA